MKQVLWMLGLGLQVIGLCAMPLGLIIGVQAGELGKEYLIAIAGFAVFMIGTGMRSLGGKGR